MKAYDLSMALICINAGIYVTSAMGVFGDLAGLDGVFNTLSIFFNPLFTIPGTDYSVRGIDALAGLLAGGTIVVLNTNLVNDRGISYGAFTVVFWTSFLMTSLVFNQINLPGISVFYVVFFLLSVMIFTMTLIQMPTGGQKNYV